MYRRLGFLVLLVLVAGAVASWLAIQPGMLQLEWLGYNLQMRTSLGVALLVILGLMLIFADRLVRGLFDLPGTMGRRLARRRAAQGHRLLFRARKTQTNSQRHLPTLCVPLSLPSLQRCFAPCF